MKKLFAILFILMLLLAQSAPLSATAACCRNRAAVNCAAACGDADCCATHPSPDSKSAPAVPAQSNPQNEISLLVPAAVIWTLPENKPDSFSSVPTSLLTAMSAPLYARNCALLL